MAKKTYFKADIREAIYPNVIDALSNKFREGRLIQFIADYHDTHIALLSSPYPTELIPFTEDDRTYIYSIFGINPKPIDQIIKKFPGPGDTHKNFTTFQSLVILCMKYYMETKQEPKRKMMTTLYVYNFYYSLFTRSFPKYAPDERIVKAAVNNMSYKFKLKELGSIEEWLVRSGEVAVKTYKDIILESDDWDLWYVQSQFKTRIGGTFNNVATEIHAMSKSGKMMATAFEKDREGNQLDVGGMVGTVSSLANKYTSKFFTTDINRAILKQCCSMQGVSDIQIANVLNILKNQKRINHVLDFYSAIFYSFFELQPNASVHDINSIRFVAQMDAIYKKGNSRNRNIMKIKDLMELWLYEGSMTFQRSIRLSTLNAYRRALFLYFVLVVSNDH